MQEGQEHVWELPRAMRQFLALERNIFPVSSHRIYLDVLDQPAGGLSYLEYDCVSIHGPDAQQPFPLKGVWIPEEACDWVAIHDNAIPSVFIRTTQTRRSFLFLIHPDSETLFQPLLDRFYDTVITVEAIALSSTRSLLVRVPDVDGMYGYYFVKVSLNCIAGAVLRILTLRECFSSIGNACILERQAQDISCTTEATQIPGATISVMKDVCAIVPHAHFIARHAAMDRTMSDREDLQCGMIIREIPAYLRDDFACVKPVPFFALWHDNGMLEDMVTCSGLVVTEFLKTYLLDPFAALIVDMLFFRNISIEAHAQNLFWLVGTGTGLPCGFAYRDMGGVNVLLTDDTIASLPDRLRDPTYYYHDSHVHDAATTIERHFVGSVLFDLTKRLVRSKALRADDPQLLAWYAQMKQRGVLCNWTLNACDDEACSRYAHQTEIPEHQYVRYGYVEELFRQSFLHAVEQRDIRSHLITRFPYLRSMFAGFERGFVNSTQEWFRPFVASMYAHWILEE